MYSFYDRMWKKNVSGTGVGLLLVALLLGGSQGAIAQDVLITEFMSIDNRILADEDGQFPDWIEIYNAGLEGVNLQGWHLTDDINDLAKWTFPAVELSPNEYLVVFASGNNRVDADKNLHTNFKLSVDGEYLALVKPDGQEVVHEYGPLYPNQNAPQEGFSYGVGMSSAKLISADSDVRIWTPTDDTLGATWTGLDFDETDWVSAANGVGYGSQEGVFSVTVHRTRDQLVSFGFAERAYIDGSNLFSKAYYGEYSTINFHNIVCDGHYGDDETFTGLRKQMDVNNFIALVTGVIQIPYDGVWTFGVNSDNGARLRIDGKDVIEDNSAHEAEDHFGVVELTAGLHEIDIFYYEYMGDAGLELFAARGEWSSFDPGRFHLVGDIANGGIPLSGFGSLIHHDVEESLRGLSASLYLRIPFQIDNPADISRLALKMFYNDGFVAYINGEEVARRNAPEVVSWDSSAVQKRSEVETLDMETIGIEIPAGLLVSATNILAIHSMNASVDDDDFLAAPKLELYSVNSKNQLFFGEPSPGGINTAGVVGFVQDTKFSHNRGFYDEPFLVDITTDTADAVIRYTTDGSTPSEDSGNVYSAPISITTTTPLRAAAFKAGYQPTDVDTHSYIFLNDVIHQTRPNDSYPTRWGGGVSSDYDMDPEVVEDEDYKDTIVDDLKTIPSISIVMDVDDLFGSQGIYTHPESKGIQWERAASTELINPDGKEGFQLNNGIRMQGGYSRVPSNHKHSFRLLFKREYGPASLRYPLFDNSPVERFDTLTIRGGYNYTWHCGSGSGPGFGSSIGRPDFIRDEFARRTQLDMGRPASHGTYVHLYLNGMYWGLYDICERPDDAFSADHFGGEKEDWDSIASGTKDIYETQVKGGDKNAWNEMMAIVYEGGFDNQDNYEAIKRYVDIPNLIDYMLSIYFTGNRDAPTQIGGSGTPWNFYSSRYRKPGAGFMFYAWDSEWILEENEIDVVRFHNGIDNPARIFRELLANPDFLIQCADQIQRHFFNGGALTPESSIKRYSNLASIIDRAIVGESARWGDAASGRAKTRDDNWVKERDRLLNDYFPVRTDIVIQQLKDFGIYPALPAPQFNHTGGDVASGFELTMETISPDHDSNIQLFEFTDEWKYISAGEASGLQWQSVEYDDSAWPSGGAGFYAGESLVTAPMNTELSNGAVTYYFRKTFEINEAIDLNEVYLWLVGVIDDGAVVYLNGQEAARIGMPNGAINQITFANRKVDDAHEEAILVPAELLKAGENVLAVEVHQHLISGNDVTFGMVPVFSVKEQGGIGEPFEIWQGPLQVPGGASYEMRIKFYKDDNGKLTGTLDSIDEDVFDIPLDKVTRTDDNWSVSFTAAQLTIGGPYLDENTVDAVWKQQTTEFPIVLKKIKYEPPKPSVLDAPIYYTVDGSDPRLSGGDINMDQARIYDAPITLDQNTIIRSRSYRDGEWSAITEASFFIGEATADLVVIQENLVISEMMYNPVAGSEYEYIELKNVHPSIALDLSGLAFTAGIDYRFANDTFLAPGSIILITPSANAEEKEAFCAYYKLGEDVLVVGPYNGKLSNSGELIMLTAADGETVVLDFEFQDGRGWPLAADGAGHSLVPLASVNEWQRSGALYYGGNWRASAFMSGSPGLDNPDADPNVVLNEIYVHSENSSSLQDWVEISNASEESVDLQGWYLSDDADMLSKWAIAELEIPSHGLIRLDKVNGLESVDGAGFDLDRLGGELYLSQLPDVEGAGRVVDAVRFKGQQADVSLGRYGDGEPFFYSMTPSGDLPNSAGIAHVVIQEIMYHPLENANQEEGAGQVEYIELLNPTDAPVALSTNGVSWRMDGGIDLVLPEGLSIAPQERLLIVGFDPNEAAEMDNFISAYNIPVNNTQIIGPYNGKLSNRGERIALEKPLLLSNSGEPAAWIIVDEVIFADQSPWPMEADGTGASLQRISPDASGNDPSNWKYAEASPCMEAGTSTAVQSWMIY